MVFVATIRPIETTTKNSLKTAGRQVGGDGILRRTPPSIAAFMFGIDGVRQSRKRKPQVTANR